MDKRYNTGNPRPSNSMKDLNDNALAYDDFLNSESDTFIDRFGNARDTIIGATKKMAAATDAVIDEARQNLLPLSRQYMTLAAAQADIANIPEGSTTYYRSPDDSALAIEAINNAGTLTATGRKMPAYSSLRRGNILFDAFNEYSSSLLTFANWDWYKGATPTFSTTDVNLPLP
ncbi:SGNH/GDSL hydrolase family protein, partial [Escherichia coli]